MDPKPRIANNGSNQSASDMLFEMQLNLHKEMQESDIKSDVLGSYTGYSLIDDEPEQDADDL